MKKLIIKVKSENKLESEFKSFDGTAEIVKHTKHNPLKDIKAFIYFNHSK